LLAVARWVSWLENPCDHGLLFDAIDIFALGEITCVGRFGELILPEHSDFKVCYLSLRSSGNYLHFPVFPAKIPQSSDIDANKPNFRGRTLGSHPGI